MIEMWRLHDHEGEHVVINPEAIDLMYPNQAIFGTVIVLRGGRVLEVREPLGALLNLVQVAEVTR